MLKKIILFIAALGLIGIFGLFLVYQSVKSSLPQLITVKDYEPLLVSQVYDRNGKKIGEFFRERRTLVPYEKIPKNLVNAFLAAEDDQFFQHKGINPQAIFRAALANLRAGRSVQGGSTITQQVAKTLLLSSEKTLTRKMRDILLALEMEKNLSKQDILFLYLNQIYFGQGAYGVEQAAQTYYRKPVSKLTLSEMAILAGLPQAPSGYSPVRNPLRAKERQMYVLHRMADVGFITKEEADKAGKEPVKVYVRENYEEYAPFFLETVRQLLVAQLGEDMVLDKGLRIYTSLDLTKQLAAQDSVMAGLKSLDKRQGYRGPLKNIADQKDVETFLKDTRAKLVGDSTPERIILPEGKFADIVPKRDEKAAKEHPLLPTYIKLRDTVQGVVQDIDDSLGLVYVQFPDSQGLIDFDTMTWARKPDSDKRYDLSTIKKPSDALKKGDVILVRVVGDKFSPTRIIGQSKKKNVTPAKLPDFGKYVDLELDQEPLVEGALLSIDQQSEDVLAMVGGTSFGKSEFNRAIQAPRQTGSSFKSIVYTAALDKGYNPSTPIMDAPLVYEEGGNSSGGDEEGQGDPKVWKPANHSKSFGGDIIVRNALSQSLNIPAVKVIEDVGVPWATEYAHRLGIYSPLNPDFTLVLGSSSVTLYEMTKVFSELGRLGKRTRPLLIHKVEDKNGKTLMETISLDARMEKELKTYDDDFENRRKEYLAIAKDPAKLEEFKKKEPKKAALAQNIFFEDADQLIKPTTAFVMTSLLRGVIEDKKGTGARARSLGREVAGKTGTTNNYYDAWFIGYSPQIATGVWVGFDKEKSLGKGEVGGRSALPIWIDYMKAAHEGLPQMTFPVPDGIVFANIDSETGKLANASTKNILRQAFVEGTEPTAASGKSEEATDFYKQDLSE
ncbi:penicillin-binding protein 1A [Bdellovibrio svalbardensis]|uniref:Penicillin-binding protein 1A n=1 Tax=Bdellovibrio svalbardensis TaxID=2972972 RepID=A0ABT6DF26_9BACT|nr:PBP1A family penicillin-binding protein [Bdellovibrio svalbardensis]MDG0815072.1 PBP1A family penicillin-binding protein [Bdellovibrio svalbardensis]